MTNSDIRPKSAASAGMGLASVSRVALTLTALGMVWFVCRFIVPKYEAWMMDAGMRPSPVVRFGLIASAIVARYFWWAALILGAGFLIFRESPPRDVRAPR